MRILTEYRRGIRRTMLTITLSRPSGFLATSTAYVDLFNLPQITAVITLTDGTAFLANFEKRPVCMCATRTTMSAYAGIAITHKPSLFQ
jgi:hypothetical protein